MIKACSLCNKKHETLDRIKPGSIYDINIHSHLDNSDKSARLFVCYDCANIILQGGENDADCFVSCLYPILQAQVMPPKGEAINE